MTQTMNRKNLYILAAVLTVVMLGFGMVMPIFPFYVESMGASGTELGLLLAISPFMQLIFAPVWGIVSDRRGRKPILAIGILGYGLSLFLFGLATELWMLFAARALGSILSSATMPTTYAYISDSTSADERAGGIGVLGAAVGLGMILGPGLGGWLASDSFSTPFFIMGGLALLTLLLLHFFLPESLPPEARSRDAGALRLRFPSWSEVQGTVISPLGALLFLAFLTSFALTNFQGIFGLYVLEKFGWGTERVGWILTVMGGVAVLTQGILAGPLSKRWGEMRVIKVTLLASAVTFGLLLLADTFAAVLLTTGLFTLPNALMRPAVVALTSKVAGGRQGAVMGLNNSATSLGRVAGPIWAGLVFDANINLPYLSGGILMLAGFVATLFWSAGSRESEPQTLDTVHN
jgi:DHA1 family multidrug resistance protein-like MFS transporter